MLLQKMHFSLQVFLLCENFIVFVTSFRKQKTDIHSSLCVTLGLSTQRAKRAAEGSRIRYGFGFLLF